MTELSIPEKVEIFTNAAKEILQGRAPSDLSVYEEGEIMNKILQQGLVGQHWPEDFELIIQSIRACGADNKILDKIADIPEAKLLIKMLKQNRGIVTEAEGKSILKNLPRLLDKSLNTTEQKKAARSLFYGVTDGEARLTFFEWVWVARIKKVISKAAWSEVLIQTHQSTSFGYTSNIKPIDRVRMFERADPQHLMSESEYQMFSNLPDGLKIYRGGINVAPKKLKYGMSWTTEINQAAWFANRYCSKEDKPVVIEATVKKENVFGCFDYENEVIIRGGRVSKMKVSEIDIKKASGLQNEKQKAELMGSTKKAA